MASKTVPMTFGLLSDGNKMQTYVLKFRLSSLVGGKKPVFKDEYFGNPMVKAKNIDNLRKDIYGSMKDKGWYYGLCNVYRPSSDCGPNHIRVGRLIGIMDLQGGKCYWHVGGSTVPRAIDTKTGRLM